MAKAKAPRKQRPEGEPEDRLIDAALALAARQGWRRTGLAEIAAEAGLGLAEAYALHRGKAGILRAFFRRTDQAVLSGTKPDAEEGARDRLFDVLMRRFDTLKPHRLAIQAIARDSVGDPAAVLRLCAVRRSIGWMLEAAGISTAGYRGRVISGLVAALYLSVLRVFVADDTEDLSRTMAALDRGLRRGEALCRYLPHGRRDASEAAA